MPSVRETRRQDPLIWNFMGELDSRCALAEVAYTALVLELGAGGAASMADRDHQRKVFLYADAFLSHASHVATILWSAARPDGLASSHVDGQIDPIVTVRKERSRTLRKLLGDDTRLLKGLARANYVSGYLDRIEAWSRLAGCQDIPDMALGPLTGVDGDDDPVAIRQFDPVTLNYQFLDQRFDLPAIAATLILTHRAIAQWAMEIVEA